MTIDLEIAFEEAVIRRNAAIDAAGRRRGQIGDHLVVQVTMNGAAYRMVATRCRGPRSS